jgi:hypothetical protein
MKLNDSSLRPFVLSQEDWVASQLSSALMNSSLYNSLALAQFASQASCAIAGSRPSLPAGGYAAESASCSGVGSAISGVLDAVPISELSKATSMTVVNP